MDTDSLHSRSVAATFVIVIVAGVLVVAVLWMMGVIGSGGDGDAAPPTTLADLTPDELAASLAGTYRLDPESVSAYVWDVPMHIGSAEGLFQVDSSGVVTGRYSYTYWLDERNTISVEATIYDSPAPVVTVAGGLLWVSAFMEYSGTDGWESESSVSGRIDATGVLEIWQGFPTWQGGTEDRPLRFVRVP